MVLTKQRGKKKERSQWPEIFLSAINGIWNCNSIFPDFSSKCQFSLTQNKISWLFPDLEEFLFSLTISWPVATLLQRTKVKSYVTSGFSKRWKFNQFKRLRGWRLWETEWCKKCPEKTGLSHQWILWMTVTSFWTHNDSKRFTFSETALRWLKWNFPHLLVFFFAKLWRALPTRCAFDRC